MTMTIPTIPALPAGYVVQLADLQALANAATFLLGKPAARVHDITGALAIGTTAVTVTFDTVDYDTDGMYSSSQKGRLTAQTPGWYKLRYAINCGTGGGTYITWATVTTGPSSPNPNFAFSPQWGGYADVPSASSPGWACAAGILPHYMYAGDYVTIKVQAGAAGTSTGTTAPGGATLGGSVLAMELVSI